MSFLRRYMKVGKDLLITCTLTSSLFMATFAILISYTKRYVVLTLSITLLLLSVLGRVCMSWKSTWG